MTRRALLLAALATLAACTRSAAPAPPTVRVHATVSAAAFEVAAQAARQRGVAELVRAASPAEAELFWLSDPAQAIALAAELAPGAAPALAGVEPAWQDPQRRFAPVCARAAVLVVASGRAPFAPERLADLADPRLAGLVALPPFTDADRTAVVGALSLARGEAATSRLLAGLARNRPRHLASDDEVRAAVARGEAAAGLVMSEAAAAGAASAAGLEVVFPDQLGAGTVVLPTAAALRAGAPDAARRVVEWLASADAERLLVARVPGLLPLREDVPVPVGVRPVRALHAPALAWDDLAGKKAQASSALAGWPQQWAR